MYIEKVPNRNSPPAVLLRESYREGDQVKKRTLANLSKLPDDIIDNLKLALKGATLSMTEGIPNHFEVIRSLSHGHVMAILETIKKLGLDKIISEKSSRIRNLVVAMISDSTTLSGQIEKVRKGWGIENVVWVSDRGILTNSKIKELVKPIEGLDYITGLTKPQIRKLAEVEVIKLGLFEQVNLVEFESEDYPDERLIACRNPLIAQKNQQQREALLEATEKELDLIVQATQREKRALKGQDKIALRVGKVLNQFKVNKYYKLEITEEGFSYQRKLELIAQETALDGVYVLRTSLESTLMDAATTVKAYKSLSQVEEAFRCYKSIDLKVRPIYHYKGDRVKAHIFLCMLAYYVEWHLKQFLAPLLFEDEEIDDGSLNVIKASRSESVQSKERKKRNQENLPVHK